MRQKWLTVVDDRTKESIDIAVQQPINVSAVIEISDRVCQFRGYPSVIRTDQGPEFAGKALAGWAHDHGVKPLLIQPGKPTNNAYIESFNGRFWNECLNDTSQPFPPSIAQSALHAKLSSPDGPSK